MSSFPRYLAALSLLGLAGLAPAQAQTFSTGVGAVTAIPDANAATNAATPVSQTITVTSASTIASFDGLTIFDLQHSYVGDLLGTITHGGITVDLFDHTGADNNPNDPNSNIGQGSAAAFSGFSTAATGYTAQNYTFALTGANLAGVPDGVVAPAGTYQASGNTTKNYDPGPINPGTTLAFDPANSANTLSMFSGMSLAGTWTLTLSDHQTDNAGQFQGFSFAVTPAAVPEASSVTALGLLLLLGAGGLALRARRAPAAG